MVSKLNSPCSATCFNVLMCTEEPFVSCLNSNTINQRNRFLSTNRWSVEIADPISLECDENLECHVHDRNGRSIKSEDQRSNGKISQPKIRSRSEEHDPYTNGSAIYDVNTPTSISSLSAMELRDLSAKTSCSCSDSNCCLALNNSVSSSGENATEIQNSNIESENHLKSGPDSSCSSCCCSPDSAVPPPMALINVKRLSFAKVSSVPNIDHQSCTETSNSKASYTLPDLPFIDLGIDSSKEPSLAIDFTNDVSMTSSGTSSLSGTNAVIDETGSVPTSVSVPSSIPVGLNVFGSMLFGCTNTSARDSGLSSHSSNSAHFSSKSTLVKTTIKTEDATKSTVSITPPPVPPHGPSSQAMAARMARIEQGQLNSSFKTPNESCTCSKRSSSQKLTNRVKGTTIRLVRYSACCDQLSKVTSTHEYLKRGDQLFIMKNQSSSSPIWKRKMFHIINPNAQSHASTNKIPTEQPKSHSLNSSLSTVEQDSKCKHLTCSACTIAWQYYLSQTPCFEYFGCRTQSVDEQFSQFQKLINSMAKMTNSEQCLSCRKHLYGVGINMFNRNPLKGLAFLSQHKFINLSSVEDIARFIRTCPDLCRSKIGAFLGLPPTDEIDTTAVLRSLLQFLNFTDLEVDEALRLLVYHYGMPVESQEIDRLLQCLTEHYFSIRWPTSHTHPKSISAPISMDQLLLIFYAVLLLQTSLHNVNAAKSSLGKQSMSQFVKNVQSFLFNPPDNQSDCSPNASEHQHSFSMAPELLAARKHTFSHNILAGMFQRIKTDPLTPGPDHTSQVRRISMAVVCSKDPSLNLTGKVLDHTLLPNLFELTESHRRLVCYCGVIHIVRKQSKEVNNLCHMFLFNDLLIIAKDAFPSKKKIIHHRKSQPKHRYNELMSFKLNSYGFHNDETQCPNSLIDCLHPPLDLIQPSPKNLNAFNSNRTDNDNQMSTLERPSTACLPYGRRNRSKMSELDYRSSHYEPTRLVVVRNISLDGCQVRPFRSSVYRYGLEIWKVHNYGPTDSNIGPTEKSSSKRLLALCTLTHADYQNLLSDLADCLRETDRVQYELAKTNSN